MNYETYNPLLFYHPREMLSTHPLLFDLRPNLVARRWMYALSVLLKELGNSNTTMKHKQIIIIISLYLVILSLPFTYGGTILSKEILICWENMSRQLQHIF